MDEYFKFLEIKENIKLRNSIEETALNTGQ